MSETNQEELLAIMWIIAAILTHNSSYYIPSVILTMLGLINFIMSIYSRIVSIRLRY